jgi:hypothetical protein
MKKIINISDEAFDLLKQISNGAAVYRDTEYNTVGEFMESDDYKNGHKTVESFLNRNTNGTYHMIPELYKYGLVDIDDMAWHTTYRLTDLGKQMLDGESIISEETDDYYECPRCEINSLTESRMCPCPRGGCEAVITGTITTTKTLNKTLSPEQIEWNKNR